MNILGLFGFVQNPAAALVVDGQLVAFAEEERFTRLKSSHGMFPGNAATYCLKAAQLTLQDIDVIAWPWDAERGRTRMPLFFAKQFVRHGLFSRRNYSAGAKTSNVAEILAYLLDVSPGRLRDRIRNGFRRAGHAGPIPKIEFVPHHVAHAYSTYACSGFDEAAIVTIDGSGEETCTQLAVGRNGSVKLLDRIQIPNSLGWFYAAFTDYLGFIPYRDEGKVMGLAPYGKADAELAEKFDRVLRIERDGYLVDPFFTLLGGHEYGANFGDELVRLFGPPRYRNEPVEERHKNIAYELQRKLEEAALAVTRKLVREQGARNLCVAGGVAMNCKMNGVLLREAGVENIFVQPASHDAGTALGAALFLAASSGEPRTAPLEHVYYGPGYTNDEIRAALDICHVSYRHVDAIEEEVARLIADGKIVAWHQGRMEFGSRALGGRSILANPTIADMHDRVNRQVKFREPWRPFCPSLLDEARGDYLEHAQHAPFMIVAYQALAPQRSRIPSVVHVDGSVRPQTVTRRANPLFHRLIETFGKLTGVPVLLNTSFNVRGEPIVCTPNEAVRCLYSTGLDALAIGNFLVVKDAKG